jgi:hypothetical protein
MTDSERQQILDVARQAPLSAATCFAGALALSAQVHEGLENTFTRNALVVCGIVPHCYAPHEPSCSKRSLAEEFGEIVQDRIEKEVF